MNKLVISKEIQGYHGYEVCSDGSVISTRGRVKKVLTPYIHANGTAEVSLRKNGATKKYLVSKLVAEAFIPNPNSLPNVVHKNGDISDNSMMNLLWSSGMDGH